MEKVTALINGEEANVSPTTSAIAALTSSDPVAASCFPFEIGISNYYNSIVNIGVSPTRYS